MDDGIMMSNLAFSPGSDSLLARYEQRDLDTSQFGLMGTLGYDSATRSMQILAFAGSPSRGERPVRYIVKSWSSAEIMVYLDPNPPQGTDASRLTFATEASGLRFKFEVQHDRRWMVAHLMQCYRASPANAE